MNRKQKIVVGLAVVLVMISGLFPAYEGEMTTNGDNLKCRLGHHFIFTPPSSYEVSCEMGSLGVDMSFLALFRSRILLSELRVQLVVIVLASVGATLLLWKRRSE